MQETGKIVKVAGPLIVAEGLKNCKMFDVVRVSDKNLIGEIMEKIYSYPKEEWNARLKETYLMGYYLQRKELYTKKEKSEENREEN